jgi:Amt family ammonium transporter
MGALDFAGGTVVHINAGVAGLVGRDPVGKRVGYGKESMAPHNLPMTMIGASLLWTGWFGFNAGSALEANGSAGARVRQHLPRPPRALSSRGCSANGCSRASRRCSAQRPVRSPASWRSRRRRQRRHPGCVRDRHRLPGLVCLWGVNGLKRMIGVDDTLDVFGVHAVGGILGALLTGIFVSPDLGGPNVVADWVTGKMEYPGYLAQLWIQAKAVGVTIVWSGVVAFIATSSSTW